MEKEIVITRKKSKSILYAVWMLLMAALLSLPIIEYFFDISWIGNDRDIPFFVIIISIPFILVMLFCCYVFVKQIFIDAPILTVNQYGIHAQMTAFNVGLISWDDIADITTFPMIDGTTYVISITLKEPEKYILDPKFLKRVTAPGYAQKNGHISLSSIYFKREFGEVMELINYYLEKHK